MILLHTIGEYEHSKNNNAITYFDILIQDTGLEIISIQ